MINAEQRKRKIVYIGLSVIVLLHAIFGVFLDSDIIEEDKRVVFKILFLLSLVVSIIVFRAYVYPFFCKRINRSTKS